MHELMFQAGVYKRNERAKRAHSLYIIKLLHIVHVKQYYIMIVYMNLYK